MHYRISITTILIGLIFTTASYCQTDHDYLFKTLTFQEGLSHPGVTDIAQDSTGYIWFGTKNGLNRYDGTEIVVFKHILGDTTSLLDNNVRKIFFDRQHRMWLITASGVCQYRPTSNDFKTYPLAVVADHEGSLPLDIAETSTGKLLVLSYHNVISVFSEERSRFEKYAEINSETAFQSLGVYQDRLFVGGKQLLLEVHPQTGQVIDSYELHNEPRPLSSGITQIKVIGEQLWIFGMMMHLHRFDPASRTLERIKQLPYTTSVASFTDEVLFTGSYEGTFLYHTGTKRASPLRSVDYQSFLNSITHVFVDQDRNLWAANQNQGVIHTAGRRIFRDIRHLNEDLVPYANEISALQIIDGQYLWLGLNTGNIAVLNLENHRYQPLPYDPKSALWPGKGTVFSIFEDRQAHVWVGSYQGGLRQYDPYSGGFTETDTEIDSLRIRSDDIRSMVEDTQGRLWLAVHGRGIDVYDPARREVVASHGYSVGDTEPYIGDWPFQLVIAPDSAVWIGSSSGLQMIKGATKKYFQRHADRPESLSNDEVNCLFLDTRGHLWIGTAKGLNLLNPEDSSFTKFTTRQGLNDNYISSVIEDAAGDLWIGTYDGLSRLSYATTPEEATIQNIALPPGLYSNQFIDRASTADSAGNLYFATTHGLLTFDPQDLPLTVSSPEVFLTDFEVVQASEKNGGEVKQASTEWNGSTINKRNRVRLAPDENTVSINFAAIDFAHSGQIRYHYRLRGYHNRWSASTERSVTYHDLPPGEYEFQVKAALANATRASSGRASSGRTSPGRSLAIVIRSPWYDTPGGKVALVLVLTALGILGAYVWLERIRLKNQAQLAKKEREIDQLKIEFFMNVSHEFRTPLTLILGPLEKLMHLVDHYDAQRHLQLIQRNTQRLSHLVSQLLDLRQLGQQRYPLRVAESDLVGFVRETCQSFRYLAEQRAIDYECKDETGGLASSWFDADILDKILYNLLSNAFKYTPDQGCIEVIISSHPAQKGWVAISVSDTGAGIRKDQLSKIFERFYRVDATASPGGTGIGLSLCQELVRRHQGEITVASTPGRGSTFTVAIPTQANAYQSHRVASLNGKKVTNEYAYAHHTNHPFVDHEVVEEAIVLAQREDSADPRPLVLVADDNADLLRFVRESISSDFIVVTAPNGQEAWQKAVATVPDVVVSDVMMPVMDGLQLVKKLKEDMRTSHIPVVLLTARANNQSQVEGLRWGADDYVTKPFSVDVLTAKLHSLIANRAKLRALFTEADQRGIQQQVQQSTENTFLLKLTEVIDQRMEDASFGTDDICRAMGMSRSQLYRKLSAVTGKSVQEFVKLYRLSRAAEMLCTSDYTVTEVANLTGFKYIQSFSRSFKEQYGCTPSQYATRHTQNV